ncbi:MAG: hypothetical protein AB7S39_07525 [Gemmatimonadales bacterium]
MNRRKLVCLAVLAMTACAAPLGVDDTSPATFRRSSTSKLTSSDPTLDASLPTSLGSLAVCPRARYDSTAAVVGPKGGTLAVGKHKFVIPARALADTVTISMVIPGDSTASVRFYPEGLQFNWLALPVLTLSYSGCDTGTAPSVVYVDDAGSILAWLSTLFLDPKNKEVQSYLQHFSRYAVAW